ncbi:hypothetical protein [Nodosilinea sp. E11]|uniref:hypothetical protein n=1 Tax=Nodosilinea sp. E11 TaxID=3037479 RepID=UPI00293484B1|nr:hypothetical protein [Nodosilinea sp. E11]WOD37140.1 hypothetical protein RRF56_01370 [Nodosilinea sp. E11]
MDEAITKPFRTISHATKHLLLNIGIASFEQVAGYVRPAALPHGLTPTDLQAVASATAICDVIIDSLSVLGLQAVVLVVHDVRPHVVALVVDGDNTFQTPWEPAVFEPLR